MTLGNPITEEIQGNGFRIFSKCRKMNPGHFRKWTLGIQYSQEKRFRKLREFREMDSGIAGNGRIWTWKVE